MQGFRYATFCFARNRAAPRQSSSELDSALGLLRHPCLYSVVPLSNKLDILGGASAEFEQIQLCTRLAPKLGLLFVLFHKTFRAEGEGGVNKKRIFASVRLNHSRRREVKKRHVRETAYLQ